MDGNVILLSFKLVAPKILVLTAPREGSVGMKHNLEFARRRTTLWLILSGISSLWVAASIGDEGLYDV